MKNPELEILNQRIEQIVREYIDACRKTAQNAVERAFTGAAQASRPSNTLRAPRTEPNSQRRTQAEIETLCDRLYQAVCEKPGETMTVLAKGLNSMAIQLKKPMAHLKQADRVRSVGQKNFTRYFPVAVADKTAAA